MVPIAVVLSLGCMVSVVLGRTSVSIEGGGRVKVGDNVNIICLCAGDSRCYSYGAVFRISGMDYTYSQLVGSVPQYSIRHGNAGYPNAKVILTLTQATLDNNGTTYKCKIFPDNWDQANMVTLSVIAPWGNSPVMVGNSFLQNNHLHQPISWKRPPHHTSQLHYIVKYGPSSVVDRPTHPSVNTTTSSNTTVILTLPIPTTPVVYNVWVAAVSHVRQGEYNRRKQIHYTTPMTAPTPIILVNRTCNAITLKWGAPPSTGGLPVLKYTLKISNNLQHSYTNVTSSSATLRQMEPNTKYTLAVRAVNFIGHSEWTESVMVTTLKRDGQSIQILKVTPNEIQAIIDRRWDKHDYNCTINDTDKIVVLSVSDGVAFGIPNLSPNTTYDIDCIGAEDQCLEVNTTVTTTATVPGEPTNPIVSQTTHNSAQLKWSAPLQKGGSEIIGYKITFTSPKHSGYYIIGIINTWKLVGLVPDNKYNIEISAINRVGIGTPANVTVKTSATVERGRDTVNVTLRGQGTKVQCDLRDSGQEHSTNTSILLPGHSSAFPLLSRGTDHTLSCTNKGTQCTGLELTVTVPSCP